MHSLKLALQQTHRSLHETIIAITAKCFIASPQSCASNAVAFHKPDLYCVEALVTAYVMIVGRQKEYDGPLDQAPAHSVQSGVPR